MENIFFLLDWFSLENGLEEALEPADVLIEM